MHISSKADKLYVASDREKKDVDKVARGGRSVHSKRGGGGSCQSVRTIQLQRP